MASPPKKPGGKKPAAKAAPKKPPARRTTTRRQTEAKAQTRSKSVREAKAAAASGSAPDGQRLPAAQQAIRDSLMIQRLAQEWTWEAIAAEAGISVSAAKKAVKVRQAVAPLRLSSDPVKIIEQIAQGYQLSIGDFEAMASVAMQRNQFAVAVGAKKGSNEAREKLLGLLQATGRLPQELGALRHLIDIRAVAVRMLDTMDEFERDMTLTLRLEGDERRAAARVAADRVRTTFNELLGIEDEEDGEVVDVEVVPQIAEHAS